MAECSAPDSNRFVLCWVWLLSNGAAFAGPTLLQAPYLDFKAHIDTDVQAGPLPHCLTRSLWGSWALFLPSDLQWRTFITSDLGRQRWGNGELDVSLGYEERPCLRKITPKLQYSFNLLIRNTGFFNRWLCGNRPKVLIFSVPERLLVPRDTELVVLAPDPLVGKTLLTCRENFLYHFTLIREGPTGLTFV